MIHACSPYARRTAISIALVSSLACAVVMLSPREALASSGHFDFGIDGKERSIRPRIPILPTAA